MVEILDSLKRKREKETDRQRDRERKGKIKKIRILWEFLNK